MKGVVARISGGAGLIVLLAGIVSPALSFAFSGYGSGASSSPYQIGTCAELQNINGNLSASYELIRDINCTGTSFSSIGPVFSGTLNGQDHTITGLIISGSGIFTTTDGATIENLNLLNGSVSDTNADVGSLIGSVSSGATTLIQNVHSTLSVSGDTYTGGLIGADVTGYLTMNQSSYDGTLTSSGSTGSYAGGLVAVAEGSTFSNDYVQGLIRSTNAAGGLFGVTDSSFSVTDSYSYVGIDINGQSEQGGLIAYLGGQVSNSFSANTITGTGVSDIGGMFGVAVTASTNSYYDSSQEEGLPCAGSGVQGCTAVDVSNTAPNYFKQNTTNAPLNDWNFSSIWQYNAGGFPTLQNQNDFNAASAPNSNDANGDGTLDQYQQNVASELNSDGAWSTVEVPSSTNCSVNSPQFKSSGQLTDDSNFIQQLGGLLDFTIYCPTAGATVPVTIIYDKLYNTTGWVLRFYNSASQQYSTINGATFGTVNIGGTTQTSVTYNVTDGGQYDGDGAANGVIVDPVGPAVASRSAPGVPDTGIGVYTSNPLRLLEEYVLTAGVLTLLGFIVRKYSTRNVRES